MARYGMLINTKKCIGCYACRTACQRQNGLDPTDSFIRFEEREVGEYPSVSVEHVPLQCMHCEDAPCASVCPTGARPHRPRRHRRGRPGPLHRLPCTALGRLPYQVRNRNEKTGAVDKCRFCNVSNYTSGTEMCSCVTACPTGARIFGDLDDPDCELVKEIAATHAAPIAGDLTKSKVYYVR